MQLWKYQQEHRNLLEKKDLYGLQRYEIGQIASKIAQLCYHYHLRTSEAKYLTQAYEFYSAIRTRGYFKQSGSPSQANTGLCLQNLRYYARFIIVSLLSNHIDTLFELTQEFSALVAQYITIPGTPDAAEWQYAVAELNRFLAAQNLCKIETTPATAPAGWFSVPVFPLAQSSAEGSRNRIAHIDHVIFVSNYHHQVKFSELTLDSFRIIRIFDQYSGQQSQILPRKHLLYRPTTHQILSTLSQVTGQPASSSSILCLYISADGLKPTTPLSFAHDIPDFCVGSLSADSLSSVSVDSLSAETPYENSPLIRPAANLLFSQTSNIPQSPCDRPSRAVLQNSHIFPISPHISGGLAMTPLLSNSPNPTDDSSHSSLKDCLYPSDLLPFLRKSLFLIVDSDNSSAFKNIRAVFDQPLLCLLSPESLPPQIKDPTRTGNLFSFFLSDPLNAFLFISDIPLISSSTFHQCHARLSSGFIDIEAALDSSATLPDSLLFMLTDPILRTFIIRFLFCFVALSYHLHFKTSPLFLPSIHPSISTDLLLHPSLSSCVLDLASLLQSPLFSSL